MISTPGVHNRLSAQSTGRRYRPPSTKNTLCDTLVVTPEASRNGVMLFGKNSDREPNEAQYLFHAPAQEHPPGSSVQCTYIAIPQARRTHAVLLSRPFWVWGAEMGVNEHGVAIGNEAVYSKVPPNRQGGLLGMDLVRLGLERAVNARQAVQVITGLLEAHGQGGQCGLYLKDYYHNSFLIADPQEAWVLDTVDRHWAARRVRGVYTISNMVSTGSQWDMASPDLVSYAVERGWCRSPETFHFGECYSDVVHTTLTFCRQRSARAAAALRAKGGVDPAAVCTVLRDHVFLAAERPVERGLYGASVCMHAGLTILRGYQSTASLIALLPPGRPPLVLATGTSAPCTSVYKPFWPDLPLPDAGPVPSARYDPRTLFWRHERLHRLALRNHAAALALFSAERDALEAELRREALALLDSPPAERAACTQRAWQRAEAAEADWLKRLHEARLPDTRPWHYRLAWKRFNRQAHFPGN